MQATRFIRLFLLYLVLMLLQINRTLQKKACPDIKIQSYKFTLSTLSSNLRNAIVGSDYVSISYCNVVAFPNTDLSTQSGYILVKINGTWKNYASNQTGPLQQHYQLIDASQPKKGISFQYVPYYRKQRTLKNMSMTVNNQTIQYMQVSDSNWLNTATIKMFCDSLQKKQPACSKIDKFVSSQIVNYSYLVSNYESQISCDVYQTQGCPTLAVNSFWDFLNNRTIVFAIILWIFAAFLLIFGYLAIRITIMLYGIFTGTFFGVIFIAENYNDFYLQFNGIFIFTICLSVAMGILFGIGLLTMPKIGYINIGVFVAAIFSLLLQNSVLFLTGSLLAFYITFGVCALIMAVISLMQLRYFIIICTSFTGAFLFVRPLGFFLPGYPNQLISGKNYKISVKTPWQFYLYLASILILTGIGIAIQRCINKRSNRGKGANDHYYLEDDGPVRDKLKKIFQFKQIKDMIKKGKKQFVQLKNLITDDKNIKFSEDVENDDDHYIQMQKMEKIQNQQSEKKKGKTIQAKTSFITPRTKPLIKQKASDQVDKIQISDDLDDLEDARSFKKPRGRQKNI